MFKNGNVLNHFCCLCTAAGVAVACPAVMCTVAETDISQCAADVDCMEGTLCCRDRRGCFGRCVPPPGKYR